MPEKVDVVVVGGGISGLTTAFELLRQSPQLKIAILEASDRIGGRTLSVSLKTKSGTDRWDVGAQWVGKAQSHVINLLKQLNVDIYPQYRLGKNQGLFNLEEGVVSYQSGDLPTNLLSGLDVWNVFRKLEKRSEKVSPNFPFEDDSAPKWNDISLGEYVASKTWTTDAKDLFDLVCESLMDSKSDNVSLLFFLMHINSGGANFDKITGEGIESAQGFRIRNGALSICEALLARLNKPNIKLHLSSPVVKIVQEPAHVTIETSLGKHFQANHVVVAIPPCQVPKIQFSPALPNAKLQLLEAMKPKGEGMKFVMTFEEAFWRQQGYSGSILCIPSHDKKTGEFLPGMVTLDAGTSKGNPALIGFADLPSHIPLEKRKELFLKQISQCFNGLPIKCIDYADRFWCNEPYINGSIASVGPKVLTPDYPTLIRAPIDRVHWAGTETATLWMGYMSGAVQAGQRAAHEILKDLKCTGFDPNMLL